MAIRYAQPLTDEKLVRLQYFAWVVSRGLGLVAALLLGIVLLSQPVMAEPAGAYRSELVRLLGEKYAEAPIAIGLTDKGAVIEVLSTHDGSTWTIILTLPNGESRVLGAGEAWISVASVIGTGI